MSASASGGEIAGYRVQSVLGEGGMGIVYLAESPQGGLCALKVLAQPLGADPSLAIRFKREAEYAEALDHPHILELYEAGQAPDGSLFFAMQYVAGADLRVLLERDGLLDLPRALSILGQVGDALDCAHAKGLVHRDVKPGNVIVAQESGGPYAYLTDFGLSKNPSEDSVALTAQGQLIGTMPYTAPEEILGQPRDHLVDIYSLGCVLYEVLVGTPPFVRERDIDVLYAHIGDPRPSVTASRPDLPPGIDEVMAKAMAIAPAERYATCAELIAAARALLPEEAAVPRDSVAASDDPVAPPEQPEAGAASVESPESAEAPVVPVTSGTLRLTVSSGSGVGRAVVVEDDLVLGRLTTLGGAFASDLEISRRHARVRRVAGGKFVVEDQYSANGTFVNGARISDPHPLRTGDELRIGATVLVAAAPEPSPESGASEVRPQIAEPVAEPPASQPEARLALRLELDHEITELTIDVEDGATVRIVRDGDGWRVDAS